MEQWYHSLEISGTKWPCYAKYVRRALPRAACRYLWCALPLVQEDYIVAYSSSVLHEEDVNHSSHGLLFGIVVDCAHWYHAGLLDLSIPNPYSQNLPYPLDDVSFTADTVYDTRVETTSGAAPCYDYVKSMSDEEFNRWCREGYYILK